MMDINLMDTKKGKGKTSFILWAVSLALLVQTQPLCAMEKKEAPLSREQRIEKARVIKQEMLRNIEDARQKAQREVGNNPFENLKQHVGELLTLPSRDVSHLDKLQALLGSKAFTEVEKEYKNVAKEYRELVDAVESAKVPLEVQQALAKRLLKETDAALVGVGSEESKNNFTQSLNIKINKIIERQEQKYKAEEEINAEKQVERRRGGGWRGRGGRGGQWTPEQRQKWVKEKILRRMTEAERQNFQKLNESEQQVLIEKRQQEWREKRCQEGGRGRGCGKGPGEGRKNWPRRTD